MVSALFADAPRRSSTKSSVLYYLSIIITGLEKTAVFPRERCNLILGYAGDSQEFLRRLQVYLGKHAGPSIDSAGLSRIETPSTIFPRD